MPQIRCWVCFGWTFRTYRTSSEASKMHAFSCIFPAYRSFSTRSHPNLHSRFFLTCISCSVISAWISPIRFSYGATRIQFLIRSFEVKTLSIPYSFVEMAQFLILDLPSLTFRLNCMVKKTWISYFSWTPLNPDSSYFWLFWVKGFPLFSLLLLVLCYKTEQFHQKFGGFFKFFFA